MPTIIQDIDDIRTATYGRDVREAIADGIQQGYDIATGARDEIFNFSRHLADVVVSQDQQPGTIYNKVWLKPNGQDLVLAEASDLEEVKCALSPPPSFTWEYYKTISDSGDKENNNRCAITNIIRCTKDDVVKNYTAASDSLSDFVCYHILYTTTNTENDTFYQKIDAQTYQKIVIPEAVTGYRFVFGRPSSYSGSLRQGTAENNASVDIIRKGPTYEYVDNAIDNANTNVQQLSSNVDQLQENIGTVAGQITGLNTDISSIQNSIGVVPSDETVEEQISELNSNLLSTSSLIENNSTAIAGIQEIIGTVPSGKTVESQLSELNDHYDILFENSFRSRYNGKKISIIGDSVDTYDSPKSKIDGYDTYYPRDGIDDINKTWWKQVINASGASLEVNASWAGSRVTDTASDPSYPSFFDRVDLIGDADVIFVTLGTTDSIHNIPLGEYDYETAYAMLPENTFRTAYIKGIKGLKAFRPQADIICIAGKMGDAYKESIASIAFNLSCTFIDASDYEVTTSPYPTVKGMRQIASLALYPTDSFLVQKHMPADAKAVGDVISDTVHFNKAQNLTDIQKATVRENIGAPLIEEVTDGTISGLRITFST